MLNKGLEGFEEGPPQYDWRLLHFGMDLLGGEDIFPLLYYLCNLGGKKGDYVN